eukprot:gene8069-9927_t
MFVKLSLSIIVLVLVLCFANAEIDALKSQQAAFDGIAAVDSQDNKIRAYTFLRNNGDSSGFVLLGTSLSGSINKNGKIEADTTSFVFLSNSKDILTYSFNYYRTKIDFSNGVENKAQSSLYLPTTLVEYKEVNGKEGFQYNGTEGNGDQILGWVRVDKLGAYSIDHSEKSINGTDGKPFKVFIVDAEAPNKLFALRFYISDSSVNIDGNEISPSQSKVDVVIKSYYDTNVNKGAQGCTINSTPIFKCASTGPSNDPESRLALVSYYLDSKFELKADIGRNELTVDGEDVDTSFNWVSKVDVDKNGAKASGKVFANVVGLDQAKYYGEGSASGSNKGGIMIHSFDAVRPDTVTWDPTFGGSGSFSSKIAIPSILIILMVVFALLF